MKPILEVRNLVTQINTARGVLNAVDGVSFSLNQGEVLGIVGESGSGKSMTCRSILQLLPPSGRIVQGEILYEGSNLLKLSPSAFNQIRGKTISMIFQEPVAVLNPVQRIGTQICEVLLEHGRAASTAEAGRRAIELLRAVGIPAPERRLNDYPYQFSGGMCQRVVIAIALACEPRLLLADEPTTALDVTIQDQILKLLLRLQKESHFSLLLVTHDMGVVAQTCQRVAVMYAGQLVELGEVRTLFQQPRHPYTAGLLRCAPRLYSETQVLTPIPGNPPDLLRPPAGCRFHPRCPLASAECKTGSFPLRQVGEGHFSACIKQEQMVDGG